MVSVDFLEVELETARFWVDLRAALPSLRLAAGLSQRQLARILGTTQGNISSSEHGREDDWSVDRVTAWLAAVGHAIGATSPEGEVVVLDHWGAEMGRWFASVRQLAGLSQGALAEIVGVSKSTVQNIEHGSASRITTVIAVLVACGWGVDIVSTDSRTPIPIGPRSIEGRKVWRQAARGRAATRLAQENRAEYTAAYQLQRSEGGRSAQRSRDSALATLCKAHIDRFRELYIEELRKGAQKGEDLR
jgi:transcriptional regulator with XRE-family HTH domain